MNRDAHCACQLAAAMESNPRCPSITRKHRATGEAVFVCRARWPTFEKFFVVLGAGNTQPTCNRPNERFKLQRVKQNVRWETAENAISSLVSLLLFLVSLLACLCVTLISSLRLSSHTHIDDCSLIASALSSHTLDSGIRRPTANSRRTLSLSH